MTYDLSELDYQPDLDFSGLAAVLKPGLASLAEIDPAKGQTRRNTTTKDQ